MSAHADHWEARARAAEAELLIQRERGKRFEERLASAERAIAQIEAKPYRAEEVTARYRRETL